MVEHRYTEYRSREWERLVEQGWTTESVDEMSDQLRERVVRIARMRPRD